MDGHVYGARLEVELVAITPEPERVIEQAGRTCYLSFERMDESSQADFIRRLIKVGHESPLEHAPTCFEDLQSLTATETRQWSRRRSPPA